MTTLTFHVARPLGRAWGPGDEVVVTELDHHANVGAVACVGARAGRDHPVGARWTRDAASSTPEDLERAITPRTRLLAIGAASNALGTISDVARGRQGGPRRRRARVRRCGALRAAHAGRRAAARAAIPGVFGVQVLRAARRRALRSQRPARVRSTSRSSSPRPTRHRSALETGTQNHEGIVGAARAVEFLAGLSGLADSREGLRASYEALHERGQELIERLWEGLGSIRGVRRYGPPPSRPRTPTVIFAIDGHRPDEVSQRLADRGLFVSSGDFYAATVMERLGRVPDGVVRAGCACYSTVEEVDRLVEGVAEIAG